jgi:hypothetical protein
MPPFEPGRKQGKAVRTKVILPITYQLNWPKVNGLRSNLFINIR